MQKMKALGSIYIGNLDPETKEKILNFEVDPEKLKKFEETEKLENVSSLNDLKELPRHTESEVLKTLNALYHNSQYFTQCGPMLISINPGPGRVNEYLNLQKWMSENSNTDDSEWKPHLYAYINYVYQTLCKENKDQAVNMLGQIGSGKTFNLIHIIEYLTLLAGPENLQVELFDMIHKSIQLIHIMGSIYRQNNVESTCCALLLKIGFNDKNKIASFDIESKIVDLTLPFSENGRSFTILHALMCANHELKKALDLPDNDQQLNFFKKFHKNFDSKTKEKFRVNDMEIWTRFHSLLNYFGFQKNEIFEILQLFSFIILLNECAIGKKKYENFDEFFLNKSSTTRKVAKSLNISEDDFLIKIGVYKSINDVKAALIKLMKYTYFLVFEYIKQKVKKYSVKYFEVLSEEYKETVNNNSIKNLFFIDIPSEVDDQTLGGLSTNLSNECLNLFASNQYLTLVEKLEKENINLKFIQPLHCVDVVNSLIGENGLSRFLSKKFTDKLFYRFKAKCNTVPYLRNTIEFSEPDNINNSTKQDQYVFRFKFSQKTVVYNLESLSLEARSMSFSKRLMNIIEMSNNKILRIILKKDTIKSNLLEAKTFFHFIHYNITEIFLPLQGLSPFIIYCFHSNNSLKIFYGEKSLEKKSGWNIPERLTNDLCKNSLIMPVLYWDWFGYHEWISIERFLTEYSKDFENIKDKLIRSKGSKGKTLSISFSQLKKEEICHFILTILIGEKQFIIGRSIIILKKGFLSDIRKIIDNLQEMNKINRKTVSTEKKENKKVGFRESKDQTKNPPESINKSSSFKKKEGKETNVNKKPKSVKFFRRNSLNVLCPYTLLVHKGKTDVNNQSVPEPLNYNLYKYLVLPDPEAILNNSLDVSVINANENKMIEEIKTVEDYTKKNNVIVVNNISTFNVFKNVLVEKSSNFELFDYSDFHNEISRISSCYRAFKARKKYKVFRYCIRKIIMMQKYIRKWIIKCKFKRFLDVSRNVKIIQTVKKNLKLVL